MSDTSAMEQAQSALSESAPALRASLASIVLAPGVSLREITSFALQSDLASHLTNSPYRIAAAAVGLAWVGPGKPKAKYAGDPVAYGGLVLDELVERGVEIPAVLKAGGILSMLALDAFGRTSQLFGKVKEQADFFGVKPASSTG